MRSNPPNLDVSDVQDNSRLRAASGHVRLPASDWLTSFLYVLMRDAVPPGEVERIVREVERDPRDGESSYTNGWLAEYARHLADRLRAAEEGRPRESNPPGQE